MVNMIHFSLPAIALGGILFALKAGEEKQKRKNTFNALSVFLILYAFFAYPPVLSTIAVVFCGMCFIECFFEERNLMEISHKFRFIVADILVSGIIFKISLKILPYLSGNVDPNAYMTQNAGISAFFKGIIPTLQSVFLQFAVTQPFLDFNYKMLWAALMIVSAAAAIFSAFRRKMNKRALFYFVIIFLLAMCASQTSVFISLDKRIMFSTRIAMFGLLFFYVFVYAMLIKQKGNIFRNIAFVFFILLSLGGISRNANAQKIWKLGFDAEKANIMQIAHAIESHPAFDPGKKYIYVAFGKQHPFREDYYFEHYDLPDERMLNYPFTPDWVPHVPLLFFARNNYIENGYSVFNGCLTPKNMQEAINEELSDFKANAKPWPMPGSVLVNDKYIAVMFDRGTL